MQTVIENQVSGPDVSGSFLVMAYAGDTLNGYFFFESGMIKAVRTLTKAKRMTLEKAEECKQKLIERYEARHDLSVLQATFSVIEV